MVQTFLRSSRIRTVWSALLLGGDIVFFYLFSTDLVLVSLSTALIIHVILLGGTLAMRLRTIAEFEHLLKQTAADAMRETADELKLQLALRGQPH